MKNQIKPEAMSQEAECHEWLVTIACGAESMPRLKEFLSEQSERPDDFYRYCIEHNDDLEV